jgi:hypothetical protein
VVATTTTLVVLSHYLHVITAKLISILAGFAVNFAMSHFVVFGPRTPSPSIATSTQNRSSYQLTEDEADRK